MNPPSAIYLLIFMLLQLTQEALLQIVGDTLLNSKGKVVLDVVTTYDVITCRAMAVYFKGTTPVTVQLWYPNDTHHYTLLWQKTLDPVTYKYPGLHYVNLEEDEYINMSSSYRLGLFTQQDPCPVPYTVLPHFSSLVSDVSFNSPPRMGEVVQFGDLEFPYLFSITLCNYTDCSDEPVAPLTSSTPGGPQKQVDTRTTTSTPTETAVKLEAESYFLNDSFLLGMLVWLILLSFIIITVILVLVCLHFRPKQKMANDGDVPDGAEPEWYVVVEDPSQIQQLQAAPSTSSLAALTN